MGWKGYDASISPHKDFDGWLEARRLKVTGSRVAALFGDHPFLSEQDALDDILGVPREVKETGAMRRGAALEDVAVQMWEEQTGRKTRRVGMKVHSELDFLAATVDRQVLSTPDSPTAALEIKVPLSWTLAKWERQGLPRYILWQLQVEALVWGYEEMHVGVLDVENWAVEDFAVPADAAVQEKIVERVSEWYQRHVVEREPLPEAEEKEPVKLPDVSVGELITVDDGPVLDAMRALAKAKDLRARATNLEAKAKYDLIRATDETEGVYEGDTLRLYYRQRPGRKSFDRRSLQREHPEIDLSKYDVQGQPYTEVRLYELTPRQEEE